MIIDHTYLHSLNPIALDLSFTLGGLHIPLMIRWYGLAYILGFYSSYRFMLWLSRRKLSPLSPELIGDFVFTAALGTILGGRLGYCLFYSPDLFTSFSSDPPFWGVLAINKGGMASHGGMIGIFLACAYFARKHMLAFPHLLDLTTIGGTIGIFFGRIANFINGELVGRAAPPDLAWGVKFPQDLSTWESSDLATLTPVVDHLGISSATWQEWISQWAFSPHAFRQVQQTVATIQERVLHGDVLIARALEPLLALRHPSQLYEALGEGAFLFILLFLVWRKPQKPGVIVGTFFCAYAVVRIIGEQFRMPDPQIGFQIFGLTRGQILSGVLLVIGVVLIQYWRTRASEKLGGWGESTIKDSNEGIRHSP